MKRMIRLMIALGISTVCYLLTIKPSKKKKAYFKDFENVLYAHRGLFDNQSNAPENSMNAFQKAVQHGYGMEVDVQLTSDHIPVVFHDFTLERVARAQNGQPVKGKVKDYTYDQLKQFHLLRSQQTIPTLENLLKCVNGSVPLIIEYKIETMDFKVSVCPIANQLLKRYQGLYCVESFNPFGLLWYRIRRPDILRGQLADNYHKDPAIKDNPFTFMAQNLMFNFLSKPDFIAYNCKFPHTISLQLCRHLFHHEAAGWTIQSEKQLKKARKDFDLFIFDSFVPVESK